MATAIRFYEKYSKNELIGISRLVEINEENHAPPGGVFLLIPSARKKLDAISQAITWHMEDDRRIAGNPVVVSGYSGRLSNS